ncbi:MAG: tRNA pseudouridine(38-40) synthase TruA [Oscillospiraceae bacterium]|nr:tRNA pseudouridine(38-40) synthase TruA [Oscillospiraceae bacterium]
MDNLRNLRCHIAYNGKGFSGFQIQPNKRTVELELNKTLSSALGEAVKVVGCSRTDAGVHARDYCFNVFTSNNSIPDNGLLRLVGGLLPTDISLKSLVTTDNDFHARYSCVGKRYVYLLCTAPTADVFVPSFHVSRSLDITEMNKSANVLIGEHDFSAFCAAEAKTRLLSTVREVTDVSVSEQNGSFTRIEVSGKGFLHNMVRIIAGTLLYVGVGRFTVEDVAYALQSGDRAKAGKTLPGYALYLEEVFYS